MKKIANRYLMLIAETIFFVIWNILVWSLVDYKKANVYFYCGYAFIFLSFLISSAVFFLFKINKNAIFSVILPSYLVTGAYFSVNFVLNTIFMIICEGTNVKAVVIPDVIILLIYAGLIIGCYFIVQHIGGNNKVIDEKVSQLKRTAIEIGQIAAITSDTDIKNMLKSLREQVEYSDPLGIDATVSYESEFSKKVGELRLLCEENYEKAFIVNKIKSASDKLRERNEILRTLK